jgi:hypothetical protein
MKTATKLFATAALAFLAGSGALMAQSTTTVDATPVAGTKNTYSLSITPYSAATETALNELKGGGTSRSMFTTVEPNAAAHTVKVVVSDARMTEQNLEIYLKGYLDSKTRKNETR